MMSGRPKDYHDYVFKDGKLVGAFEDMYKYAGEMPWHQDTTPNTWHGRIGTNVIEAAFEESPIASVIETGSGYGYILARLARPGVKLHGFDISQTAVEKACQLHPAIDFFVDDLVNMKCERQYDLVICRENLWYVTDHLEKALENLWRLTAPGKDLYVGLAFPALEGKFIGKEVLSRPETLVAMLERKFESVVVNQLLKKRFPKDGPNLHWLGQKKQ